jgi:hypothetical protein
MEVTPRPGLLPTTRHITIDSRHHLSPATHTSRRKTIKTQQMNQKRTSDLLSVGQLGGRSPLRLLIRCARHTEFVFSVFRPLRTFRRAFGHATAGLYHPCSHLARGSKRLRATSKPEHLPSDRRSSTLALVHTRYDSVSLAWFRRMDVYAGLAVTIDNRMRSSANRVWRRSGHREVYHAQLRYHQKDRFSITGCDFSVTEIPNLRLSLFEVDVVVRGVWFRDTTSFAIRCASGFEVGSP